MSSTVASKVPTALKNAQLRTPKGFEKVLAVSVGFGIDLHGHDPTVAAAAAVKDAATRTSLPGILNFVPGGADKVKIKVKVAVPNAAKVNIDTLKQNLYSEHPEIKVVNGGLRWQSGIIMPQVGDPKPEQTAGEEEAYSSEDEDAIDASKEGVSAADDFLAAVAAIRVGY